MKLDTQTFVFLFFVLMLSIIAANKSYAWLQKMEANNGATEKSY